MTQRSLFTRCCAQLAGAVASILSTVEISIVILGLSVLCGLLFSFEMPIATRLGESGMGVITRVMGMILAAIAMGMLTDGFKAMLPGLAG
jgi:multiple antibiotic resistance protein